jgi:hypothetical protein
MEPVEDSKTPNTAQKSFQEMDTKSADAKYIGVSGWLFIFALGVFLNPLILGKDLIDSISGLSDYKLVFPGSYFPTMATVVDVISFVLTSFGLYLFVKRKKLVRKFYIWSLLAIALMETAAVNEMTADINNAVQAGRITKMIGDAITTPGSKVAGQAGLLALIWVPYLIRSKRVKANFVN